MYSAAAATVVELYITQLRQSAQSIASWLCVVLQYDKHIQTELY